MRSLVVGEVFRRMPSQVKPAAAPPDCVIRWRIGEGEKVETWFCIFEAGRLKTTTRDPETPPRTTLEFRLQISSAWPRVPSCRWRCSRTAASRSLGDLFFAAQLQGCSRSPPSYYQMALAVSDHDEVAAAILDDVVVGVLIAKRRDDEGSSSARPPPSSRTPEVRRAGSMADGLAPCRDVQLLRSALRREPDFDPEVLVSLRFST